MVRRDEVLAGLVRMRVGDVYHAPTQASVQAFQKQCAILTHSAASLVICSSACLSLLSSSSSGCATSSAPRLPYCPALESSKRGSTSSICSLQVSRRLYDCMHDRLTSREGRRFRPRQDAQIPIKNVSVPPTFSPSPHQGRPCVAAVAFRAYQLEQTAHMKPLRYLPLCRSCRWLLYRRLARLMASGKRYNGRK